MTFNRPPSGWNYKGPTTHPGEMLKKEFIEPMGLKQESLAASLGMSGCHLSHIVTGKRGVTPKTAIKLADYFGNSAEFWMNLQTNYDLSVARRSL